MNDDTVEKLARLFQKLAETYYAQGQSRMQEFEHGWKGTAGPGSGGTVPALNLWMATQLLGLGFTPPPSEQLDALLVRFTVAAADRSRKGR